MTSQNTGRARRDIPPQALPPIHTLLGTELSLPLPSSPWERQQSSRMDVDYVRAHGSEAARHLPSSRPRAFTVSSHPGSRDPPSGSRRSPPLHRSSSQSLPASATNPTYLNVLRPSRSGALITSVPTVRARSRSMPQPPFLQGSASASTPSSRAESEGARRHVCPICQKRFNRPSSLKTHTNSHTGSRPFACPHPGCDKVFSVSSNMRRHHLRVHGHDGDDDTFGGGEADSDGDIYMEEPENDGNYEWAAAYEGPLRS